MLQSSSKVKIVRIHAIRIGYCVTPASFSPLYILITIFQDKFHSAREQDLPVVAHKTASLLGSLMCFNSHLIALLPLLLFTLWR